MPVPLPAKVVVVDAATIRLRDWIRVGDRYHEVVDLFALQPAQRGKSLLLDDGRLYHLARGVPLTAHRPL
ncbi:hypothetical protein GCM10027168_36050 [Streptomyces capparidis]